MLVDATGKYLPARHVYMLFIKAFVDHFMYSAKSRNLNLKLHKIRLVIPISADLTDTGEQILQSFVQVGVFSNI